MFRILLLLIVTWLGVVVTWPAPLPQPPPAATRATRAAPATPTDSDLSAYQNINLEEVLKNERLYRKYIECLLGKGKCTQDARRFKGILPEAIRTNCGKCSDLQKTRTKKAMKFIREHHPGDFDALIKQYDPSGEFAKKYLHEWE